MADAPAPRLLARAQLRAYMGGMAWADILGRIESGRLPSPLWALHPADPRALGPPGRGPRP